MFYVYVLRSKKTGQLMSDPVRINERLRRHNAGESNATKQGVPWRLLHTESFATRAAKLRYENATTKWDEVAMSLIGLRPSPRRPLYQAKLHPELLLMLIMLEPSSHPETLACDLSPRRPLYQAKLHLGALNMGDVPTMRRQRSHLEIAEFWSPRRANLRREAACS